MAKAARTTEAQPDLLGMKDVTPKKATMTNAEAKKAVKAEPIAPKKNEVATVGPARGKAQVAKHANDNPNMLAVIARAAADPNVNVEKMQALLNMQKEIVAEEARMASIRAFIALQDELPSIGRDGKIEIREKVQGERSGRVQQSTPYASFNNIMKVLKPLLRKHRFGLHFETVSTAPIVHGDSLIERLVVRGVLEHDLGHVRTTEFPLPMESSGSKNPVQGWGSSMSYGKRYATIALLNIISEAQEDRDTDGNANKETLQPMKGGGFADVEPRPKITKAEADELLRIINECGVPLGAFATHYEIDKIGDLPADLFAAAKKRCEDHKQKKKDLKSHG